MSNRPWLLPLSPIRRAAPAGDGRGMDAPTRQPHNLPYTLNINAGNVSQHFFAHTSGYASGNATLVRACASTSYSACRWGSGHVLSPRDRISKSPARNLFKLMRSLKSINMIDPQSQSRTTCASPQDAYLPSTLVAATWPWPTGLIGGWVLCSLAA